MSPICRLRRPRLALLPARQRNADRGLEGLAEALDPWRGWDDDEEDWPPAPQKCAGCWGTICVCADCAKTYRLRGGALLAGRYLCSRECRKAYWKRKVQAMRSRAFPVLAFAFDGAKR